MDKTLRILHISDLHFSAGKKWEQDPVLSRLAEDVGRVVGGGLRPDAIAVTGDVANTGSRKEYEMAARWFREHLLPATGLSAERLWIVPGNHDVDRRRILNAAKAGHKALLQLDTDALQGELKNTLSNPEERKPYLTRHDEFVRFLDKLKAAGSECKLPWWKKTIEIRGLKVHVAGLCSSWLCEENQDQGRLLIGQWQINTLVSSGSKADLRIVLLHHPWSFIDQDDVDAFEPELKRSTDLVLRGHLHKNSIEARVSPGSGSMLEISAGSSYAGSRYPNGYQFIEIDLADRTLRVHPRMWDVESANWSTQLRASHPDGVIKLSLPGRDWWHFLSANVSLTPADSPVVDHALKELERRHQDVRELLRRCAWDDAIGVLSALEVDVERVVKSITNDEAKNLLNAVRLNRLNGLFNAGRLIEGRTFAETLDAATLKPSHRAALATLWLAFDAPDRARQVVALGVEGTAILQKLAITEDRIPEGPPVDDEVRHHLARLHLRRFRFAEAAALGLELDAVGQTAPLLKMIACDVMFFALVGSINEQGPPASVVAEPDRATLLARIERTLGDESLPATLRQGQVRIGSQFYRMMREYELAEQFGDPSFPVDAPRIEPAGPWSLAVREAELLLASGREEDAIAQLEEISHTWPNRWPVERDLSHRLTVKGQFERAQAHAEASFRLLPTRWARLELALCHFNLGRSAEAWRLLDCLDLGPIAEANGPEAALRANLLALRAYTGAATGHSDESRRDLETLSRERQWLARDRLFFAETLGRAGEWSRVLDVALQTLETCEREWTGQGIGLDSDGLGRLGRLLLSIRPLTSTIRDAVQRIAAHLRSRFGGDPAAEFTRLDLVARLGFPEGSASIDLGMLESAGLARVATLDEFVGLLRANINSMEKTDALYRRGVFDWETVHRENKLRSAERFLLLAESTEADTPFVAPVSMRPRPPLALRGKRLLIGELELLMLRELDLLNEVQRALGDEGRVLVFDDVWDRIAHDDLLLSSRVSEVALERDRALAAFVAEYTRTETRVPNEADADMARRLGAVFVEESPSSPEHWGWSTLAASLDAVEGLNQGQRSRFSPQGAPRPLPSALLLDYASLKTWVNAGAAAALARVTLLLIDEDTKHNIHADVRRQESSLRAAEQQRVIHTWLAKLNHEGQLHRVERTLHGRSIVLPPVRPPSHEATPGDLNWVRQLGERLLSWLGPAKDPDTVVLTADPIVGGWAEGRVPRVISAGFAWTHTSLMPLQQTLNEVSSRLLHLPQFVDALELAPARRTKALRRLLELGFFEWGRTTVLEGLSADYPSLRRGQPDRLLSRIEARARWPEGHEDVFYRASLGYFYARTLLTLAAKPQATELGRLTSELLMRIASVELDKPGVLIGFANVLVWESMMAPLNPQAGGRLGVASPEEAELWIEEIKNISEPLQTVWTTLFHWASGVPEREGPLNMVLRTMLATWTESDAPPEDVSVLLRARAARLLGDLRISASTPDALGPRGVLEFIEPMDEVCALLTPFDERWPSPSYQINAHPGSPTLETSLDLVEVLKRLADADAGLEARSDGRFIESTLPVGEDGSIRVRVPVEGLALRMRGEPRERFLRWLAGVQGALDCRLAGLLQSMREHPDDQAVAQRYARTALRAPFRALREDPALVGSLDLGILGQGGIVGSLAELREILGEPDPIGDVALVEVVRTRLAEGGAWHARPDVSRLISLLQLFPGDLGEHIAADWLFNREDPTRIVPALINVLDHPNDHGAGEIAANLLQLCIITAIQPLVRLSAGLVDLRERLPNLVSGLLRTLMNTPSLVTPSRGETGGEGVALDIPHLDSSGANSLVHAEGPILRSCAGVVRRLAGREPTPIPEREILWLTWRLFGWFLGCVGQEIQYKRLARLAPAPNPDAYRPASPLDPDLIGPHGLDLRLAAVLHALLLFSALNRMTLNGVTEEECTQFGQAGLIHSAELRSILLTLAGRSFTPGEVQLRNTESHPAMLEWGDARTVPDLALDLLLQHEPDAACDLPTESLLRHLGDTLSLAPGRERSRDGLALVLAAHLPTRSEDEKIQIYKIMLDDSRPGNLGLRLLIGAAMSQEPGSEAATQGQALLLSHAAKPETAEALSHWFAIVADHGEEALRRSLKLAEAHGAAPKSLITALFRVAANPSPLSDIARGWIRDIAANPELSRDLDILRTLTMLGLDSPYD